MTRLIRLDDVRDIPSSEEAALNGHAKPAHSWQPASLLQLAANPPAPPTIGGLLYPGKRTVLSGETESMKTWLALILCKAEMEVGLPVAWVDLDAMGPGALLERLQLLGVQDEQIASDFLYYQPAEMLDPLKLDDVCHHIRTLGIRLFVIDAFNPILGLHALDPNSTPDIETFWRTIATPISDAGASPCLLDHVVKNPEGRGKYAYGSERKASGIDGVHIGFKLLEPLSKGGIGRTLLTVHKDRPGYLPRPALGRLIVDATGDQIDYQLEPDKSHDEQGSFRPTVLMERISRYLEKQDGAVTQTNVEENVPGKVSALRTALKTLCGDAYCIVKDGPNKAHLYTSLRPYREANDAPARPPSLARPPSVPDLRSSIRPPSPPPKGGRGRTETLSEHPFASVRPLKDGAPIHEYDFPPYDPTLEPDPEEADQ